MFSITRGKARRTPSMSFFSTERAAVSMSRSHPAYTSGGLSYATDNSA
jgi:hypothetical protein